MRRRRKQRDEAEMEVSMTPMIDVVFQLLIYFLVTFSTPDVMAHLDISRPAPDPSQKETRPPPRMIRIHVYPDGYSINGRAVSPAELGSLLGRLAGLSSKQTLLITAAPDSDHDRLVRVLDICAEHNLSKISVVSAP